MSQKKQDLPAMPFYVGDWLKAPDIQCLNYELKGLWFEMLCYMWESKERGVLLYSQEELSRLLRLPEVLLEQKLKQLSDKGIFSVRECDGAIFNRRMVKDQSIREIRSKSGYLGGKNSFASRFAQAKVQAKGQANSENENEIENEYEKKQKRFTAPTIEEVKTYCKERGNNINAQNFVDFYEAKDWMIGKNRMKNWKAAVRTWETRNGNGAEKKRVESKPVEYKPVSEKERAELDKMMAETREKLKITIGQ